MTVVVCGTVIARIFFDYVFRGLFQFYYLTASGRSAGRADGTWRNRGPFRALFLLVLGIGVLFFGLPLFEGVQRDPVSAIGVGGISRMGFRLYN